MTNQEENSFVLAFLEYLDLTVELFDRFDEIHQKYKIDIVSISKDQTKLLEVMAQLNPDLLGHFLQLLIKYVGVLRNPPQIMGDQSPEVKNQMNNLKEDIKKLQDKVDQLQLSEKNESSSVKSDN